MTDLEKKEYLHLLQSWQIQRLEKTRSIAHFPPGPENVTVLSYHFWSEPENDNQFQFLESALLETYLHCGMMKTTIVTRFCTPALVKFAEKFSGWITLVEEDSLEPGNINSMSIDCISHLHEYFKTDYVLIIQNDGFPIRQGLDAYIGKWDFVGSPVIRNRWWITLICFFTNTWFSNGGFSLRSKKICKLASEYWKRKYANKTWSNDLIEDVFYTWTLPKREPFYRWRVKIAPSSVGSRFSHSLIEPYDHPFGFHGPEEFNNLFHRGLVPDAHKLSSHQDGITNNKQIRP